MKDGLDGQLMPGLDPAGVPKGLKGTAIPFSLMILDSLREIIKGKENNIAAIMIEPARGEEAPKEYLSQLKDLAAEIGAVLIFDEITSGFRMCPGGIHRRYGIYPDMAVFRQINGKWLCYGRSYGYRIGYAGSAINIYFKYQLD